MWSLQMWLLARPLRLTAEERKHSAHSAELMTGPHR